MTHTEAELQGRLMEAEDLERAIAAGEFSSLSELQLELQRRAINRQADLRAWATLNALLTPTATPTTLH